VCGFGSGRGFAGDEFFVAERALHALADGCLGDSDVFFAVGAFYDYGHIRGLRW